MNIYNTFFVTFIILLINTSTTFAYSIQHDTVINESYNGTEKLYDFVVKSGQGFSAVLNAHFTEGSVYLYIKNENGVTLKSDGSISNGQTGIVEKKFEADGTYYIRVAGDAVGSYELAIYNAWFNQGSDDSNRTFHSSIYTSKLIPKIDAAFNVENSENPSYFRFNVLAGQGFTAILTSHFTEGSVYLYLKNEKGETLNSDGSILNGQTGIVEKKFESNGTYYIKVAGDGVGSYDLALYNAWFNSGINDRNRDFYSTRFTARNMINGSHQTNHFANDWYRFSVQAGKTISVRIKAQISEGSLYLYLKNADGETLVSKGSIYNDQTQVITKQLMKTDVYYIVVKQIDSKGYYTLSLGSPPTIQTVDSKDVFSFVNFKNLIADPIDASIGSHLIQRNLIQLQGAIPLNAILRYSSLKPKNTITGYGWNHNFDMFLSIFEDNSIEVKWASGHLTHYYPDEDGKKYTNMDGNNYDILIKNEDGSFTLTNKELSIYSFNHLGQLLSITNRNGVVTRLTYDSGRLKAVSDPISGRSIQYSYKDNLLNTISADGAGQITLAHDNDGNLISITDQLGYSVSYIYDSNHRVLSGTNESGIIVFKNTYDESGRITSQDDALEETQAVQISYSIDSKGNHITNFTDRNNHTSIYTYDQQYRLIMKENPLGNKQLYEYDSYGNQVEKIDPNGNATKYFYDSRGNVISTEDAMQRITHNVFDNKNNLIITIDPKGNQTRMTYNDKNQLLSFQDAMGYITQYSYDDQGFKQSVVLPNNGIKTYSYNKGQMISETDANGNITQYEYDSAGRLIKITDPYERAILKSYDLKGQLLSKTTSTNAVTFNKYDPVGQLIQIIDPLKNTTQNDYDHNCNLIRKIDPLNNVTTYDYDPEGRLIKTTNPLNQITRYQYDATGKLLAKTDPSGHTTTYIYDKSGMLLQIINPLNNRTTFSYDNVYNLIETIDSLGNKTIYTYDENNNMATITDAFGSVITNTYDSKNRLVRITDALGNIITNTYDEFDNLLSNSNKRGQTSYFTYDSNNNLITVTDALGNDTTNTYDKKNRLIEVVDPQNKTESYTYDEMDNLLSTTDSSGNTTINTYDKNNNLATVKDALGNITSYAYDQKNRLIKVTDPKGNCTAYTYDEMDNIISTTDASGNTTIKTYDEAGRLHKITDEEGYVTTYTYDPLGKLLTVKDPLNNITTTSYDANGNLIAFSDATGFTTTHSYDALGRLITTKDALGNTTKYSYDASGRNTSITDSNNNTTLFTYDPMGKILSSTNAQGNTTSYKYDAMDNLIEVMDAAANKTIYTYDSMSRLIKTSDRLNNNRENKYDAVGNLIRIKDEMGNTTFFAYDKVGNYIRTTDANGNSIINEYDENYNLIKTTDLNGNTTTYEYDVLNRLTKETNSLGHSIIQSYNPRGLLSSITNSKNQTISYEYDANGRLIKEIFPDSSIEYVLDSNGNTIETIHEVNQKTKFSYDRLHRLISRTDAFGKTVKYTYTSTGHIENVIYSDNRTVHYTYDNSDRMQTVTDWDGRKTIYEYSTTDQLIKTILPDGSIVKITYDNGNRLIKYEDTKDNVTISRFDYTLNSIGNQIEVSAILPLLPVFTGYENTFIYNSANQLIQKDSDTYTFDANGNMTERKVNGNIQRLTYDPMNRLKSIGNTNYTYDADDLRITKDDNGVVNHFTHDINWPLTHIIEEFDEEGTITARYVYGLGLISREDISGDYKVYHFDSNGSTIALTDENGMIADRYAYDPFGKLLTKEGVTPNPFIYNGRYGVVYDGNNLYYMRARYYDAEIKRFIQQDTVKGDFKNPQSLNQYAFVNGNPINMVDPLGLAGETAKSFLGDYSYFVSSDFFSQDNYFDMLSDFSQGIQQGTKNTIIGAWEATKTSFNDVGTGISQGVHSLNKGSLLEGNLYLGKVVLDTVSAPINIIAGGAKGSWKGVDDGKYSQKLIDTTIIIKNVADIRNSLKSARMFTKQKHSLLKVNKELREIPLTRLTRSIKNQLKYKSSIKQTKLQLELQRNIKPPKSGAPVKADGMQWRDAKAKYTFNPVKWKLWKSKKPNELKLKALERKVANEKNIANNYSNQLKELSNKPQKIINRFSKSPPTKQVLKELFLALPYHGKNAAYINKMQKIGTTTTTYSAYNLMNNFWNKADH